MVSANETREQKDEVQIQLLAYDRPGHDDDTPTQDGLYVLINKMSRTALDLCNSMVIAVYLSPRC